MNALPVELSSLVGAAVLQGTGVTLLVLALVTLLPRRAAALRSGLLLLALLKLAVPPFVPVAMPSRLSEPVFGLGQGQPVLPAWPTWLLGIYAFGSAVLVVFGLVRWIASRRVVQRAHEVRFGALHRLHARLARQLGYGRAVPRLLISADVASPCALGIFRPAVLLPCRFTSDAVDPETLRAVLAHELAHLWRRDPLQNAVAVWLAPLWWPHPLYWFLARALRRAQEDCCDDLALATTTDSALSYAGRLLDAARFCLPAAPPLLAASGLGEHHLARRFRRLACQRAIGTGRRSVKATLCLVLLAVLLLPGLAPRRAHDGVATDPTVAPGEDTLLFLIDPEHHRDAHRRRHRQRHGH